MEEPGLLIKTEMNILKTKLKIKKTALSDEGSLIKDIS